MSDLSNDFSTSSRGIKSHRHSTNEYRLYLGLIFLATLPICAVIWTYTLIRQAELPEKGPVRSALSEARSLAPRIFWT